MPQTIEVRLNLPTEVVESIDQAAEAANDSRDRIVSEALKSALPASRQAAKRAVNRTITSLNDLSDEELRARAVAWFPEAKDRRLSELLQEKQYRPLSVAEGQELKELTQEGELHALQVPAAHLLLRKRSRQKQRLK